MTTTQSTPRNEDRAQDRDRELERAIPMHSSSPLARGHPVRIGDRHIAEREHAGSRRRGASTTTEGVALTATVVPAGRIGRHALVLAWRPGVAGVRPRWLPSGGNGGYG